MMVEEYSRIVQAADDVFISQKNINGDGNATKNGYAMSIESFDNSLTNERHKNPPKRQRATEIFGRGWADIMPFLKRQRGY